MTSVGIVGASGFIGAELLRLAATHPQLDVRYATGDSQAGTRAAEVYPALAAAYGDLAFEKYDAEAYAGLDLVFLALPHGASQEIVPEDQIFPPQQSEEDAQEEGAAEMAGSQSVATATALR